MFNPIFLGRQSNLAANTPTLLFNPLSSDYRAIVTKIVACNVSGADDKISIYHDASGSSATDDTAIARLTNLPDGQTLEIPGKMGLSNASNHIYVENQTLNSTTFTAFGYYIKLNSTAITYQLGQVRPSVSGTFLTIGGPSGPGGVYSPRCWQIEKITVTNYGAGAGTFSICLDNAGTTYNGATALYWDEPIQKNELRQLNNLNWMMTDSSANLAFATDIPNDVTFTVYGTDYQLLTNL